MFVCLSVHLSVCVHIGAGTTITSDLYSRSILLGGRVAIRFVDGVKFALQHICSVLFFSRPRSECWPHHGRTFSIYLCHSVILTDSSTESPVHVLMLSIQAVRGLPRLRAPGIVPCIIS